MKKGIVTVAVLLICFLAANAQDDYKMFVSIMLEPNLDQITQFEKNVAEHNKEYHSEGFKKAGVWSIMSGSNSGKYAWVMGPLTYTDFDGDNPSVEHDAHWNDKIAALCSSVGELEWWKLNDDLSYVPEGSDSETDIYSVYDITPGQGYRFKEVLKKVAAVYKAKEYPDYFRVYYSEFNSNSNRDVAISNGFKTWASLDEKSTFKKDFEEVHGEYSWMDFITEYHASFVSMEDELSIYLPHLSGGEE
jgi:hypothetical protein